MNGYDLILGYMVKLFIQLPEPAQKYVIDYMEADFRMKKGGSDV